MDVEYRQAHLLLGLNGECEHSVGPTALSVHRGGSHSPVGPASGQHLVGLSGRGHTCLQETIHIYTMLDILSEVQATGGGVNEVIHLGERGRRLYNNDTRGL